MNPSHGNASMFTYFYIFYTLSGAPATMQHVNHSDREGKHGIGREGKTGAEKTWRTKRRNTQGMQTKALSNQHLFAKRSANLCIQNKVSLLKIGKNKVKTEPIVEGIGARSLFSCSQGLEYSFAHLFSRSCP